MAHIKTVIIGDIYQNSANNDTGLYATQKYIVDSETDITTNILIFTVVILYFKKHW